MIRKNEFAKSSLTPVHEEIDNEQKIDSNAGTMVDDAGQPIVIDN